MSSPNPEEFIRSYLRESARVKESVIALAPQIAAVAKTIVQVAQNGGTIYLCGNGGSACDAMHFTEELVAVYKRTRPGIRAQHFFDAGTLTCWSNDRSFESVFERQAQTFVTNKDALVGFTTSGNSENVLRAFDAARKNGGICIGFLGKDGGKAKAQVDHALIVESNTTAHIQEAHIAIVHILCDLVESDLFPEAK